MQKILQEKDITITTDVDDFEMDPISISGVPMSFDINTDDMDTSALTDKTKDLTDGVKSLNDGAKQLKSGSSELQSGISAYGEGVNALYKGADTLFAGVNKLNPGIKAYTTGVDQTASGAKQLQKQTKNLPNLMTQMTSAITQLKSGLYSGDKSMKAYLTILQTQISGENGLTSGIDTMILGVSNLKQSICGTQAQSIKSGTQTFYDKTGNIDDQILDGIDDAINEFSGKDYKVKSFVSSKNKNVKSVQFVMKTEGITKEEKETKTTESTKSTIIDKIKGLFK